MRTWGGAIFLRTPILELQEGRRKKSVSHYETEERVGEQDGHESRWALLTLQRLPSLPGSVCVFTAPCFSDDIIAMNRRKTTRGRGRGRGGGGARGTGQRQPLNRQTQVSSFMVVLSSSQGD